ncbi:hypothetical protein [Leifsonia aquatica]|uniref:hypothetical protein n=1 Tax=Leifsonia aquatica TaxID=144185 RepID=UPI0004688386|nr:hypothetical protein [Leifsonia aquatica]
MPGKFNVEKVTLGELLADDDGHALIAELAPDILTHPMLGMAKKLPLPALLKMAGGQISPEDAAAFTRRVAEL